MSHMKNAFHIVVAVIVYFAIIAAVLAMTTPASGYEIPDGKEYPPPTTEPFRLIATEPPQWTPPPFTPPPVGTFFATRNSEAVGNKTPGSWWNHIGIMGPNGWVIEAQAGPGFVIAVPFDVFYLRYPQITAFRPKRTPPEIGPAVAAAAAAQMGREYHRVTNNCVSVARRAVGFVKPRKPLRWRRPDDVLKNAAEIYWRKNEPTPTLAEPFRGATKDPADLSRASQ